MKPAARITDPHLCPLVSGTVPHTGGPILPPGAPMVLIAGMPAARQGDLALCVGGPDSIAMGSPTVLIAGRMAARLGDSTVHGGTIAGGCPTVLIGDAGGGSSTAEGQTLLAAFATGAAFTSTGCGLAGQADDQADEGSEWIEVEVVRPDGTPLAACHCRITPPGSAPRDVWTDERGIARLGRIGPGQCEVRLPDFDRERWHAQ